MFEILNIGLKCLSHVQDSCWIKTLFGFHSKPDLLYFTPYSEPDGKCLTRFEKREEGAVPCLWNTCIVAG